MHIHIHYYMYIYTYTYTYSYECNVSHARNTRIPNAHIIIIMFFTHMNEQSPAGSVTRDCYHSMILKCRSQHLRMVTVTGLTHRHATHLSESCHTQVVPHILLVRMTQSRNESWNYRKSNCHGSHAQACHIGQRIVLHTGSTTRCTHVHESLHG